jgi:multiple sugar transport system permease protein
MNDQRSFSYFWKKYRVGFFFMAPAFLLILVFAIYPLFYTVFLSFNKYNMGSGVPRSFIGIANYRELLKDMEFTRSLLVTLISTFWGVGFTLIFGVILALLLNKEGLIPGVLRAVSLMPMLIASAALSVAWTLMYNYSFGLLNAILGIFGLPGINFLGEVSNALPSLIVLDIWQFTPFVMILVLAGLKGIPMELYEAAAIDGASRTQSFFHITLPSLRNILITTTIMRIIDTFKTFEKPYMMTNGGPALSTQTINLMVYSKAFNRYELGYGAAGALLITIMIGILSVLFMRFVNTEK